LEGAHVVDGPSGAGEAILGAEFSGLGCFCSRVGAGFGVAGGVFRRGSAAKDVAGIEGGGGANGQSDEKERGDSGSEAVEAGQRLEGADVVA
jgi:hypothetical protein